MRNFWIISMYTFRDAIGKRFSKIFVVVMTLLILLISVFPDLIFKLGVLNEKKEYLFYILDDKNYIFDDHLELNLYANNISTSLDGEYFFHLVSGDENIYDVDTYLEKGIINGYLVVNGVNDIDIVTSGKYSDLKFIIDRYIINNRLFSTDQNYNKDLYINYGIGNSKTTEGKFQETLKKYMLPSVLAMFVYAIFVAYGQFISINTNIEKNSKITEIFLTKVKLLNIILGKIFGMLLACILQLVYFLVLFFVVLWLLKNVDSSVVKHIVEFDFIFIMKYILYFILGFILYGLMFMLVGSIVSKTEDLSIGLIPITLLISLGYVALLLNIQYPQNDLIEILRYVPVFTQFMIISKIPKSIFGEIIMLGSMLLCICLLVMLNIKAIRSVIIFRGDSRKKLRKSKN